jgi:hypothetical protein
VSQCTQAAPVQSSGRVHPGRTHESASFGSCVRPLASSGGALPVRRERRPYRPGTPSVPDRRDKRLPAGIPQTTERPLLLLFCLTVLLRSSGACRVSAGASGGARQRLAPHIQQNVRAPHLASMNPRAALPRRLEVAHTVVRPRSAAPRHGAAQLPAPPDRGFGQVSAGQLRQPDPAATVRPPGKPSTASVETSADRPSPNAYAATCKQS